jgi:hypothetical protein
MRPKKKDGSPGYPGLPWTQHGRVMLGIKSLRVKDIKNYIPKELTICQFLGRTIGAIYLAQYNEKSHPLVYDELAIICSLVKFKKNKKTYRGFWISHIYVNDKQSLESGRPLWGWPKEWADFAWSKDEEDKVTVSQKENKLCMADLGAKKKKYLSFSINRFIMKRLIKKIGGLPFFGKREEKGKKDTLIYFTGKGSFSMYPFTNIKCTVPQDSPFYKLGFSGPMLYVYEDHLDMIYGDDEPEELTEL